MIRFTTTTTSAMLCLLASSSVRAFVAPSARRAVSRTVVKAAAEASTAAKASDTDFDGFSSKISFMFPGQGAQFVGMCGEVVETVPAAKALFEEASEILGYDLLELCTNGPKEKLDSTEVSQPAIFVASMAAVEKLKQEQGQDVLDTATCAMGLSLGEYSALCFADAISFADGVKITKARGEAMQAASDAADSGMVSVIGLDKSKVAELCAMASEKSGANVQIANYLCNGNYAVSGASAACDAVAELAKPEFKARMTVKLAVAGAFHTDFMAPAVSALEDVLKEVTISKPRIPVISNVDAKPHSDPETIKQLLATQVTSPVQWESTMDSILEGGLEKAYELGPGKVTAGILKRFDKKKECENVAV
eukprot:CAMPEP_0194029272 /NCGR_PEP_ID=MMETSP0009_2-20130614/3046_1 /TAXON_ID=210454 /ORGANISM="Grammatophora oceanica, Strain CCMP 410" /LENGTH=364 /DNA_ID=CAMNT_0038668891 /DNA_START=309 /DNA_END=1403 /DNA_ORIENTATION=-